MRDRVVHSLQVIQRSGDVKMQAVPAVRVRTMTAKRGRKVRSLNNLRVGSKLLDLVVPDILACSRLCLSHPHPPPQ